jgi:hypothetical protein
MHTLLHAILTSLFTRHDLSCSLFVVCCIKIHSISIVIFKSSSALLNILPFKCIAHTEKQTQIS